MIEFFVPEAISPQTTLVLILASCITSFVTASLGIGGGLLLIILMANVLPIGALIPVHGLVQFGSNANRMMLTHRHLDKGIFAYFVFGAILAAVISIFVIVQLPANVIQISIAVFVLLLTWGVKPKKRELPNSLQILTGFITTFLSMFLGATGPLVASVLHAQRTDKHAIVATFAACMSMQHGLKIFTFGFIGFIFTDWLGLIALMIISGFIGTWIGLKALNKIPAEKFAIIFKILITLLAIRLLISPFLG
ncbi:TSUP family transporter [Glaciecola sp. 1036]|uniref:TSUP family transporter n=1 Tax=Alteromonadaceae TaxID=72275 RepID=UPI003D05814C